MLTLQYREETNNKRRSRVIYLSTHLKEWAAQHGVHAALGFVRFVGESRPTSRRYLKLGATRSPDGDDVLYRMISRAVETVEKV